MPAQGLSVIIITYNEAKHVAATIDAAWQVGDEIIIADSGSTDDTKAIALGKGVTFLENSWPGFGAQRNFAVSKAHHPFILALDADEVLSTELIAAINKEKQQGFPANAYALQRLNNYYGKFVHHGIGYPDNVERLYNKSIAAWNNRAVHETIEYSQDVAVKKLAGFLLHYTTGSISDHIIKSDKYSSLSAQHYFDKGKKEPGFLKLVLSPWFKFFKSYFLKAGFLDGWHGYILARMHAKVVFDKYAKLKILYRQQKEKNWR
ncbi:MAG: glycosyltransferase family 2 protein [Sphingobacteriales bacterium]|nr:MAG: glycosyltransferase family 2 protein [Sphingobacteriales bacterium]